MLIPGNALPRTATATQHRTTFGWEQIDHPPYSPDLALSDYYLFKHLKSFLGDQRFHNDDDVKQAVKTWFTLQAGNVCDEGMQRPVTRYDDTNNVEK